MTEYVNQTGEVALHAISGYWKALECDDEGFPHTQIVRAYDKSNTYVAILSLFIVDEQLAFTKVSFVFTGTWHLKGKIITTEVNQFDFKDDTTKQYLTDNPEVMAHATERFSGLLNTPQEHNIIHLTDNTLHTEHKGELTMLNKQA